MFGLGFTPCGVFYGSMCLRIELLGLVEGQLIDSYPVLVDVYRSDSLLEYIRDMLENGYPVITSIWVDSDYDLHFYTLSDTLTNSTTHKLGDAEYYFNSRHKAHGHYFNITGLIYDDIAEEVYLRVSNHGVQEYIYFSEFLQTIKDHRECKDLFQAGWDLGNLIVYID